MELKLEGEVAEKNDALADKKMQMVYWWMHDRCPALQQMAKKTISI